MHKDVTLTKEQFDKIKLLDLIIKWQRDFKDFNRNGFIYVIETINGEYELRPFNPRQQNWGDNWRRCYELRIPEWVKSIADYLKSKRVRIRRVWWTQHPHDGCYFETARTVWLFLE
ncbi:hypothetical protein [Acinetobacter phage vB_AbaS_TCUP2199]|nr:hypothetical protein [Acinetobacter phage vB_AbaS_TCUP2199]